MISLLFDENFDRRMLRGLRLRTPTLDYVIAQGLPIKGAPDPEVLAWAAENGRIVVTHDISTMPRYAYERIDAGMDMPGVIVVPEDLAIGIAIEELLVLIECCDAGEFDKQVKYVPI